jgi:hypothetical protein
MSTQRSTGTGVLKIEIAIRIGYANQVKSYPEKRKICHSTLLHSQSILDVIHFGVSLMSSFSILNSDTNEIRSGYD